MNPEYAFMILMPLNSLLFMAGGYKEKGWRRYVLPICNAVLAFFFGIALWRVVLFTILSGAAYTLPYGENSSWGIRILTACSFGASILPLGFTWLIFLPPIVFITGWVLSNRFKLQWKVVEGFVGMSIAAAVATVLYNKKGVKK